jgi:lipopolysaccharide transport system permease protein
MNEPVQPTVPVTVIKPRKGWQVIDFGELVAYRDLFYFLTHRAIRTRYAQSGLGLGWAVIQPVATTIVFTLVFGRGLGIQDSDIPDPVNKMSALVMWLYFQSAVTEGIQTLVAEQNMISKIYFPRLILPISRILARLLDFFVSLLILGALMLYYGIVPNWALLLFPLLVLMMLCSAAGLGLLFGAMAVQYRDINHAMGFVMRLLLFTTPVIFSVQMIVPDEYAQYRPIYALNPMVGVIEGFRYALFKDLSVDPVPWDLILPSMLTSVVTLVAGAMYFRRKERVFADVA